MLFTTLKDSIKEISFFHLLEHITFYLFFGICIAFFDKSIICRLCTWFFEFILISATVSLITIPSKIITEVKKNHKKINPLLYGINELILLLFVIFLTYNHSWVILFLFISCVITATLAFSVNHNKEVETCK